MSELSIRIDGLEKVYKGTRRGEADVHALKPLRLDIAAGEVFGLLGPNGAGKTTLVKLLLGIVHPTTGGGTILNRPIGSTASKELIGYLPESHRYPLYLSGDGVLDYFGRLSGVDRPTRRRRADELLELVKMTRWRKTRVRKYSKGMMQRLGLAQALINDPQVVFLDEPTDGVDPLGRKEIREIIAHLRSQRKTIFLNSHLLSEVELICDRVAILNHGELLRIGTVRELTETSKRFRLETSGATAGLLATVIAPLAAADATDDAATLSVRDHAELNALIDRLRAAGISITGITPLRMTLEELFLDVVKNDGGAA